VVRFDELVLSFFVAAHFKRNVGQHFVGIHVGRRSRAPLVEVGEKLVVIFSVDHGLASLLDGIYSFFFHSPHFGVGAGRRQLDDGIGPDVVGIKIGFHTADLEILQRAKRLNTVVGIGGNLLFTQQVFLCAGLLCLRMLNADEQQQRQ